jgi:benzoyl-CoA reductase/2-hydroxyglutaryl-CoA dehydratase subunit BcrC/BadD/HgdB
MMLEYFQNLETGLEAKLKETGLQARARKKMALEIARLGIRLYSGEDRVAWCGVAAPFDLLNAVGVTSCFVEFVGAMLASTGNAAPMLEAAEQAGYATDICSYHRAINGAALQDLMPRPDFLIATTCPCSSGMATVENLARHFEKDLFVLNIPSREDRESVRYLADQLRSLVEFVAAHTGRPLDPACFRETMERANRAREIMIEVYNLARTVPTPARRRDLVNFSFIMMLLMGTEAAIETAEVYRDEFKRRVAAGAGGVDGEKLRLLWIQNRIQFKNPLEKWIEEEFGAAVVVDELNDVTWDPVDPQDPYPGLAARLLSFPLNGPIERRIEHLQRQAKGYQVDGVLAPCHWGCRQGTGARGLMADGMKQIGVPFLALEVDCVDPRQFSEGQLRTRLQAFFEMLQNQKAQG